MIIDDLDLFGVGAGPMEAEPPLVVDPDGVLSLTVPLEGFQAVARRQPEKGQFDRGIEELQLDEGALPQIARQAPGAEG